MSHSEHTGNSSAGSFSQGKRLPVPLAESSASGKMQTPERSAAHKSVRLGPTQTLCCPRLSLACFLGFRGSRADSNWSRPLRRKWIRIRKHIYLVYLYVRGIPLYMAWTAIRSFLPLDLNAKNLWTLAPTYLLNKAPHPRFLFYTPPVHIHISPK